MSPRLYVLNPSAPPTELSSLVHIAERTVNKIIAFNQLGFDASPWMQLLQEHYETNVLKQPWP